MRLHHLLSLVLTLAMFTHCDDGGKKTTDKCKDVTCGANATCNAGIGECECDFDYVGDPDAGCTPSSESGELTVSWYGGYPVRLYVADEGGELSGWFIVDTGSQLTFIFGDETSPQWVPDVASVVIAGQTISVGSRPVVPWGESYSGLPVIGILGNDVLFGDAQRWVEPAGPAGAWELDIAGGRIVHHRTLPSTTNWYAIPYENVYDFMFTDVTIDGSTVRLAIDTGASNTLWIGQEGRTGDTPIDTQDGYGNPITLWEGLSVVQVGNAPAVEVPVYRTPTFPSLEDGNEAMGVDAVGLLGLSVLGARVLFDAGNDQVWIYR